MRKYVLALSIAAMIGGLGFAGAAAAADPPTQVFAPAATATTHDVQASPALPLAASTAPADTVVAFAVAGPASVYRPGMTPEELRAAVLQRVANPQPCNCGPRWRS